MEKFCKKVFCVYMVLFNMFCEKCRLGKEFM